MIRDIAGRHNQSAKLARRLQKKKIRRERGLLVAEGRDLLEAAIQAEADIREVLVRSDVADALPKVVLERAQAGVFDVGVCSSDLMRTLSSLGGAADVVFVCGEPRWNLADVAIADGVCVYLDGVGDPGNVGTLVRSGVAFGASAVVCSPGTADPFGPKAMRAGMGAQFLLPVVTDVTAADLKAWLQGVRLKGLSPLRTLVADSHNGEDSRCIEGSAKGTILVLGDERLGPASAWEGEPRVCIAQQRFDSLNVAMAGTILLYELGRTAGGNASVGPIGLEARKEES